MREKIIEAIMKMPHTIQFARITIERQDTEIRMGAMTQLVNHIQLAVRDATPEGCTPADAQVLREANHQLAQENHTMRTALERIACWHGEFPATGKFWPGSENEISYATEHGSNGERDYMRGVARVAVAPQVEAAPVKVQAQWIPDPRDPLHTRIRNPNWRPDGSVTQEDIDAAKEHISDVHNETQLRSALGQLRLDVVWELARLGLVSDYFGAQPAQAAPVMDAQPVATDEHVKVLIEAQGYKFHKMPEEVKDRDRRAIQAVFDATFAKPVALPHDLFSHKSAWRNALNLAVKNAAPPTADSDDPAYWMHEVRAFDRVYLELEALAAAQPAPVSDAQPVDGRKAYADGRGAYECTVLGPGKPQAMRFDELPRHEKAQWIASAAVKSAQPVEVQRVPSAELAKVQKERDALEVIALEMVKVFARLDPIGARKFAESIKPTGTEGVAA